MSQTYLTSDTGKVYTMLGACFGQVCRLGIKLVSDRSCHHFRVNIAT